MDDNEFFTEYGEANRYRIQEVIGRGSYGVVCSAIDNHTGERVAIKKINDIFEHVSDATRILREIKLLRLLKHPDIVEVKHILLPPSRREFKDIYVIFELMESDLHQVIKANDDLTPEHYQFFLYQLLRALKYIHTANVFHRDLKPKNILANADCKLKICDFGLARVAFNDAPTAIFWTDYVATRWYRAPELCGSFFSKYTPAIDIWSLGCIFAEVLTRKPLFPGKNVVDQLELMTDLLGTPPQDAINKVRNEKARRYLSSMQKKPPVSLLKRFPHIDPSAVRLLERMLSFDPAQRPTAEEALADPYFKGLAKVEREPSAQPITKLEFEFERRRINMDDVRELIYREILEYHPKMLKDYLSGSEHSNFMYPSAVDQFKRQFAHLEDNYGKGGVPPSPPLERQHASLPRERIGSQTAEYVPASTEQGSAYRGWDKEKGDKEKGGDRGGYGYVQRERERGTAVQGQGHGLGRTTSVPGGVPDRGATNATRPGRPVGQNPAAYAHASSTVQSGAPNGYYRENPVQAGQRRYKSSSVGTAAGGNFPRRPSSDRLRDLEQESEPKRNIDASRAR